MAETLEEIARNLCAGVKCSVGGCNPLSLDYPVFPVVRERFQNFRLQADLIGFKQQNNGGTRQLEVAFFAAFDEPGVFFFVENPANHQGTDLALDHRTEMLGG